MGDDTTLGDLHILDLSEGIAGAYAAKLFADYGADVIKVEPVGGDPSRRHGPFLNDEPHLETGALWLYLNTNKRGVTLDIAQPTGRRLFRLLVELAQVIIETYPPGYLDSLGLGFRRLTEIKGRIVLVSVTPYGQWGPYARHKSTNLTAFAIGGQMSLTGEPQREPLKNAGYQAEYQAGLHAFAAAAIAAFFADASDVPQHIDVSAMEGMASMLEHYLPWWAYLKRDISQRRGGAPIALVHTLGDLLKSPQLQARRYFQAIDHPKAGRLTYPGPPFRLREIDWPRQGRGAPLLGEDNQEVYCGELGLSRQELARLRAAGVV